VFLVFLRARRICRGAAETLVFRVVRIEKHDSGRWKSEPMSRDTEATMDSSLQLDRTLRRVRRRLTWHRRLDLGVRGLLLGAGGALVVIVWHAVADPRLPWRAAAGLAVAAGLLPYLAYGLHRRVSSTSAAWFLDRRLAAGGRILTLEEPRGEPGPIETAFFSRLESEVSGLLGAHWSPSWVRTVRRLATLGVIVAAAGLVLLLGPAAPPAPGTGMPATAHGSGDHAPALERLSLALGAQGETALAERLAREAQRLGRGQAADPETERLLGELEERLRRHGLIVAVRTALGESATGRALARRLLGRDGRGDGVAVTAADESEERIALLEKVTRLPGLPAALERELRRALAAARVGNPEAFAAAAAAFREQLGPEGPAALLAESAERLASVRTGAAASDAPLGPPGKGAGHAGGEKPGRRSRAGVRGEPETTPVLDPNLRRVIRRYFASRGREHE
jgi:hypothetical protein